MRSSVESISRYASSYDIWTDSRYPRVITSSKERMRSNAFLRTTFSSISVARVNYWFWLTLIAVLNNNLIQLSQHFKVFNDVWVFVRDKDQKQFFNWYIHIPNYVCFNVSALLARFQKLGEVCHVLLKFEPIDCHELTSHENFPRFWTNWCADYDHNQIN